MSQLSQSLPSTQPAQQQTTEPLPAFTNEYVGLEDTLKELQLWRSQQPSGAPIPNELWHKIFQLSQYFSHEKIKAIFGFNNSLYHKKRQELCPDTIKATKKPSPVPPLDFCEIKTIPSHYQSIDELATHTIVVEFCRADGQIMKIHTVNSNFKTLIQLFLGDHHDSN